MNNKYIDNKMREFKEKFCPTTPTDGWVDDIKTLDAYQEIAIEQFIKEALEQAIDKGYNEAVHHYLLTLKPEKVQDKVQEECLCHCHCKIRPCIHWETNGNGESCTHCQKPEDENKVENFVSQNKKMDTDSEE